MFGPVVCPAPSGPPADDLWNLCVAYTRIDGLYEIKTPKTSVDLDAITTAFAPYLSAREWSTIETAAP